MALSERSPEEFARAAELRLTLAASMYQRVSHLPFGDRHVQMPNVAMLVWSAGIDLISAHMLRDGETSLGTSVSRRRYLMNRILPAYRPTRLRSGWGVIARLHSFQHNPHLNEADTQSAYFSVPMRLLRTHSQSIS